MSSSAAEDFVFAGDGAVSGYRFWGCELIFFEGLFLLRSWNAICSPQAFLPLMSCLALQNGISL